MSTINIVNRAGCRAICMTGFLMVLVVFCGCNKPARPFTVGIVSYAPLDAPALKGFRDGMTEAGYVEGKEINYIYRNVLDRDEQTIDAEIREVFSRNVDLLVTTESNVSLRAKEIVKGTDMPVLFIGEPTPLEIGLVESISNPGGNLTGIRALETTLKAMEWLKEIVPEARKVYIPCKTDDPASILVLSKLDRLAPALGIEIIFEKISTVEEATADIEGLQAGDVDAVFLIPSLTLNPRSGELIQAANNGGFPTFSSMQLDKSILFTLVNDFNDSGRKAARLAREIFAGTKVKDLPVETSELLLTINLATAEKIDLFIPDSVLMQASTIIR